MDKSILQLIPFKKFSDDRGYFIATPIEPDWIQENLSLSNRGVFRGMHFQIGDFAQTKMIRVIQGSVVDIVIDLRPKSTTYLEVTTFHLSDQVPQYLLVPKGYAHGFLTLEDNTLFQYRIDTIYHPESERSIHWSSMPNITAILSKYNVLPEKITIASKDAAAPGLKTWLEKSEPVLPKD